MVNKLQIVLLIVLGVVLIGVVAYTQLSEIVSFSPTSQKPAPTAIKGNLRPLPPSALCGNGQINSGEQCDGRNLNNQSCQSLGYNGGSLGCITQDTTNSTNSTNSTMACTFNVDGCFSCVDTDGGSYPYTFGRVARTYGNGQVSNTQDACRNSNMLNEVFCAGGWNDNVDIYCNQLGNYVCQNGACVPGNSTGGGNGTGGSNQTNLSYRVFISSQTWPGHLGGVNGADAKCLNVSRIAGLGGNWKAWVSSNESSPSTRFFRSTLPYKRLDGVTVADNWNDLVDGSLDNPINRNERGQIPSNLSVWTGTNENGFLFNNAYTCSAWSDSTIRFTGLWGDASFIDERWTNHRISGCRNYLRLLCFEQP